MPAPTTLKYFDDTYELEGDATVVNVLSSADVSDETLRKALSKHAAAVVLDQTLFYAQGGGQPSDIGTLAFGETTFAVRHVFAYQGQVYHQGDFSAPCAALGASAHMCVDRDTRLRNARCHSAGHVIFSVVRHTWHEMHEKKGHHFDDGAYVEFDGILPADESVDAFQKRIDHVVDQHVPVSVRMDQSDGGLLRFIQVGDFLENPCGGTHVTNTSEIGRIAIRKIARRAGQNTTKISYRIESA
ncbi:hypothetical protein LPJ59_000166 [Coemansia sp. RSA 2399]|nr:hypothetical protein LPJ59_000166 [Coemansia sp. RSA 2399]KAJ1908181.1 hypothetical protein LPJ81_000257 [Coemansia sp. IMI 209127]